MAISDYVTEVEQLMSNPEGNGEDIIPTAQLRALLKENDSLRRRTPKITPQQKEALDTCKMWLDDILNSRKDEPKYTPSFRGPGG